MKRVTLLIWLLLLFFSSLNAQSGKAKSLELGNRWIYQSSDSSRFSEEVILDTVINNKIYAMIRRGYDIRFERADSIRLYGFSNGEYTVVDFSYEVGDSIFPDLTIFSKDTINLWGEMLTRIVYCYNFGFQKDFYTYVEKLGLIKYVGDGMGSGGPFGISLVAALIGNNSYGDSTLLNIREINEASVNDYLLSQNYPNPFNSETYIKYRLNKFSRIELVVYDILGNEIVQLIDEEKPQGDYLVSFNADNYKLSSGIYFYEFKTTDGVFVRKMIYLK